MAAAAQYRRRVTQLLGAWAGPCFGLAVVLAFPALSPGPAAGAGLKVESVKRITGGTPFPDACGNTDPRAAGSEADPHFAVDPNNRKRIIVGYGQDRMLGGSGVLAGVIARSSDGGAKWRETLLPRTTQCTGGMEERTGSAVPSIGPDGSVYALSEVFTIPEDAPGGPFTPNPLIASRSRDGGASFAKPRTIVDAGEPEFTASITADPQRSGQAYAVWTRPEARGLNGVEYFARTTDHGKSWSDPRAISSAVPWGRTSPNLIEVLPDGDLLNLYVEHNISVLFSPPHDPYVIRAQRSTNRGRTWSRPVTVAEIPYPGFPTDPDSGIEVDRTSTISTGVARDGTAYVVWNDNESAKSARVLLARSQNGGRNWSEPETVAQLGAQAFSPALAVGRDGSVGVSFYDFRNDVSGDGIFSTDVWFYYSHTRGRSWRHKHLSGSFDALAAPENSFGLISSARHVGGLDVAALPGGFGAVFAQAAPKAERGPTDLFFARLRLGKPQVEVRSLPDRCTRNGFRIDVRVKSGSGLERVRTLLDGRRIRQNRKKRFSMRVPAGNLGSGRHRLRVEAEDRDGAVGASVEHFRRCARR